MSRDPGRGLRYAVRPDRFEAVVQTMAQAAQWNSRLQSIKRLAESTHRDRQHDT
jgi:hypothetical protein